MKRIKRTISIIMCAALLLGLLSTVALAEGPTDVGADFTTDPTAALVALNAAKTTGAEDSTWADNTLTLKGVDFTTTATTAVKLPGGSTIVLADGTTNTISGGSTESGDCYGIYAAGDLTIQGTGKLTVTSGNITAAAGSAPFDSCGIYAEGSVTISGGTVEATGGNVTRGNSTAGLRSYGIYVSDSVTISGGAVTAQSGTAPNRSYGIYAYNGNIAVTGGTVNATGSAANYSYGIDAHEGSVTIENGGKVIAASGTAGENGAGIYAGKGVTISGGTTEVTAEGGAAANNSYGIEAHNGDVTITDAKVEATGGNEADESYSIYAKSYDTGSGSYAGGEVAISGDAEVTATGGNESEVSEGIDADNVTISGSAVVTATGGTARYYYEDGDYYGYSIGIEAYDFVKISGGTVNATGGTAGSNSIGIDAYRGSVTIENGKVNATGGKATDEYGYSCGIYAYTYVKISGGTVIATGDTADEYSDGICAENVTIYGGTVTATSGATNAEYGESTGIWASYDVTISGGTVTATGSTAAYESHGIWAGRYDINSQFVAGSVKISGGTVIAEVTPAVSSDDSVALLATATSPTASALSVAPTTLPTTYWWRISNSGDYSAYPGSAYTWNPADTYVEIRNTEPGTNPDPGPSPNPILPPVIPIVSTYPVTAAQPENGAVTISPANAAAGNTVTVTVTPDEGYELTGLTVTDANGNRLPLTQTGENKYTFTMPAGKVSVSAAFSRAALPFTDVPADAYYYDAVAWAVENGITEGTGDGTTFSPNAPCTRGQIVTFLWRAAGCPEPESSVNPFTDVAEDAYYFKAMLWAVENGITFGTGDGTTFSPDAVCTRDQTVTFLWRAIGKPAATAGQSFTDVSADAYYASAVQWAVENGITFGTGDGTTFSPADDCTRAQIITFLWRCMK